jgi:micrococcal nuclease
MSPCPHAPARAFFLALLVTLPCGCERGCGTEESARLLPAPAADAAGSKALPVIKIVDGDTIWVKGPEGKDKVRLLCVDTPEVTGKKKHPLGSEATKFLEGMVKGKKVVLEADDAQGDRDRFGRLLRYVLTEKGLNVNVEIVRSGWSAYYVKYGESTRFHLDFLKAEKEARKDAKGIWADPLFLSSGYLANAKGTE